MAQISAAAAVGVFAGSIVSAAAGFFQRAS